MAKMSFIIYFQKRVQYLLSGHHAQQATHQEVWRHAQEMEEKVSDDVELDVCATMLGLVERGQ